MNYIVYKSLAMSHIDTHTLVRLQKAQSLQKLKISPFKTPHPPKVKFIENQSFQNHHSVSE